LGKKKPPLHPREPRHLGLRARSNKVLSRGRGTHGRHKVDRSEEVHEILEVGPMGEPIRPTEVIAMFSNQVVVITRDKVEITWEN
jgi:hypothetical protein